MRMVRPAFANSPLAFGRRGAAVAIEAAPERAARADDLRLFATSFAVGFLFVSVLIF